MKKFTHYFILLWLISPAGLATTINFGDYQYTTGENSFSGNGLEWLRWDLTANQSVDSALDTYQALGWRLANSQEMANLFNSFAIAPANHFGNDESQSYQQVLPLVDAPTVYDDIIAFLGTTFFDAGGASGDGELARLFSAAIYGSDDNNNGFVNGAIIQSDMTFQGSSYDNVALLFEDSFYVTNQVYEGAGIALVRNITQVPEPGQLSLFLALMFVLRLMKRK